MSSPRAPWETQEEVTGCAYITDERGVGRATCGAPCRENPRPIARRIMRCAMSLMAARPRPTTCAK